METADQHHGPVDGSAVLQAWLTKVGETPTQFGLRVGIDPAHLRHILARRRRRITVDTAVLIEDGTGGQVAVRVWCLRESPVARRRRIPRTRVASKAAA